MNRDPIGTIARAVRLSARDVVRIISYGPRRYRIYTIPKRSGAGDRTIAQPSKPLKIIQRYLVSEYLEKLKVSSAAQAYRKGRNIRTNAEVHARSRVIMKLDFENFFHSIIPVDLISRLPADIKEDQTLLKIFELSLFWLDPSSKRLCLAIGAPSSPIVSNCVMFEFDEAVKEIVTPIGVNYTRYADDLTFSGERIETLESVEREVRRLLANTRSPVIRLNERKRGIYTRGMKRMITGVKVTPKGAISIGRERKRLISSFVFRASIKKLSKDQLIVTQGWLAFANTVEPEFLDRLRKKYGNIVDLLLRQSTK